MIEPLSIRRNILLGGGLCCAARSDRLSCECARIQRSRASQEWPFKDSGPKKFPLSANNSTLESGSFVSERPPLIGEVAQASPRTRHHCHEGPTGPQQGKMMRHPEFGARLSHDCCCQIPIAHCLAHLASRAWVKAPLLPLVVGTPCGRRDRSHSYPPAANHLGRAR